MPKPQNDHDSHKLEHGDTLEPGDIWALIRSAYASSFPYLLIVVGALIAATLIISSFPTILHVLLGLAGVVLGVVLVTRALTQQRDTPPDA